MAVCRASVLVGLAVCLLGLAVCDAIPEASAPTNATLLWTHNFSTPDSHLELSSVYRIEITTTAKAWLLIVGIATAEGEKGVPTLWRLDEDTGETVWKAQLPAGKRVADFMRTELSLDQRTVYLAFDSGLTAVDTSTGKTVWTWSDPTVQFSWMSMTGLSRDGARVYANTAGKGKGTKGAMLAVDAAKGTLLWKVESNVSVALSAVVEAEAGAVFLRFGSGKINVLVRNATTGAPVRTIEQGDTDAIGATPDGRVFVECLSDDNGGAQVQGRDGRTWASLWNLTVPDPSDVMSEFFFAADSKTVFFITSAETDFSTALWSVDAATGSATQKGLGAWSWSAPASYGLDPSAHLAALFAVDTDAPASRFTTFDVATGASVAVGHPPLVPFPTSLPGFEYSNQVTVGRPDAHGRSRLFFLVECMDHAVVTCMEC